MHHADGLANQVTTVGIPNSTSGAVRRLNLNRAAVRAGHPSQTCPVTADSLPYESEEVTFVWRPALNPRSVTAALAPKKESAQPFPMDSAPDAVLIAAVRRDPPDETALDTLVDRYWRILFARCQMLTLNREKASDLAQEAWCRVLRARHSLKPEGNFPAYLLTIATNLWRDANRSARRAGPMAEHRLASLDAALPNVEGESVMLRDVLPDLNVLETEEHKLLAMDIDRALAALTPLLRDVLTSRFLIGDSCAAIGQRYGRTEQTISGWVREGLRQLKSHLEEPESAVRP